jgi:hypothetical protein
MKARQQMLETIKLEEFKGTGEKYAKEYPQGSDSFMLYRDG